MTGGLFVVVTVERSTRAGRRQHRVCRPAGGRHAQRPNPIRPGRRPPVHNHWSEATATLRRIVRVCRPPNGRHTRDARARDHGWRGSSGGGRHTRTVGDERRPISGRVVPPSPTSDHADIRETDSARQAATRHRPAPQPAAPGRHTQQTRPPDHRPRVSSVGWSTRAGWQQHRAASSMSSREWTTHATTQADSVRLMAARRRLRRCQPRGREQQPRPLSHCPRLPSGERPTRRKAQVPADLPACRPGNGRHAGRRRTSTTDGGQASARRPAHGRHAADRIRFGQAGGDSPSACAAASRLGARSSHACRITSASSATGMRSR